MLGNKVKTVFKEGVKQDVDFETVIRKKARQQVIDGVIIVTFKSKKDKERIMSIKSKLASSEQYKKVKIFHDLRVMKANMKTLVDTIAKDSLVMKGNRIMKKEKHLMA